MDVRAGRYTENVPIPKVTTVTEFILPMSVYSVFKKKKEKKSVSRLLAVCVGRLCSCPFKTRQT